MTSAMLSILADGARELGIELSDGQLRQFDQYSTILQDWSQRVSLTAVRDAEGIERRHFLESAAILPVLADEDLTLEDKSLIDVGSGSGVPGVPLKILVPSLRLTLVEAKQRKAEFLNALLPELSLYDVTILTRRSEEVARNPQHREQYDFAIAKALAPLRTLAELTLPLVHMGGVVIAPKSQNAEQEVKEAEMALDVLKGSVRANADLPLAEPAQRLVLLDKDLPTPDRFPRRPGVPAKRPL